MFKWLLQKLGRLGGNRESFDPSRFADPLAMQIKWMPARAGGANFGTHELVKVAPYRVEFRASIGAKLFYMLFFLLGIGLLIGFSISLLLKGAFSFSADNVSPLLTGAVFAIVGGCMFYIGTTPIVFDKQNGYFWKGRKDPAKVININSLKCSTSIEQIHSLQLISEYCRGNKASYYSYELNLVLNDGQRINVIDHGNLRKIRDDARVLSEFLERPVWDAI